MTDPKIVKVNTAITKTKTIIADYQKKLRDLEREKTRLEDERIVALVRSERISDAELTALMQSLRKEEPKPAEASANNKPRQEETRDANIET